jgi:DNA (cytosine-5)-methyltransferase 1
VKYRALDLFCGAGGAAMGLHRAGFDVTGIDIKPQPRYPFRFIRGDALRPPMRLEDFDLIWASPPCQGYSIMRNLPWLKDREYPMLIPAVRQMLKASGSEFIIENVNQARRRASLPEGIEGGYLCGAMFGLPLYRHRRFETSFHWFAPAHPRHEAVIRPGRMLGSRASDVRFGQFPGRRAGTSVGHGPGARRVQASMGVEWMVGDEAGQAIPPVFSEHIGRYAIMALEHSRDLQAAMDAVWGKVKSTERRTP